MFQTCALVINLIEVSSRCSCFGEATSGTEVTSGTHRQLIKVMLAFHEGNYPVNLKYIKWLSSKYSGVEIEHNLVLC